MFVSDVWVLSAWDENFGMTMTNGIPPMPLRGWIVPVGGSTPDRLKARPALGWLWTGSGLALDRRKIGIFLTQPPFCAIIHFSHSHHSHHSHSHHSQPSTPSTLRNETRHTSPLSPHSGFLLLREYLYHRHNTGGGLPPSGNLRQLPPVLHRKAETRGYLRTSGTLPAQIRRRRESGLNPAPARPLRRPPPPYRIPRAR